MTATLDVLVREETGTPYLYVPGEAMWSLLEFLSWQRVRASYTYETNRCAVYFLYADLQTARRLIDEWQQCR